MDELLPLVPPFDHQRSELVDVIAHPGDTEFVQVWRVGHTEVLLSYFRTRRGVTDVHHNIPLEGGPWRSIDVVGVTREFRYSRRGTLTSRTESFLPSGRLMVDDLPSGLRLERRYSPSFDWVSWKPTGRNLGDRATARLQDTGGVWFVSTSQRTYDENDVLVSDELVLVEEYRGRTLVKRVENRHANTRT